jgi:hypothetical protein
MTDRANLPDISMDANALYREEAFTDRRVGSIQRLTPIKSDGSEDSEREVIYLGQTQLMTPAGALPLSFEIKAASLEDAISQFGAQAEAALEDTMKRLEEMRRESASSLIVPGGGAPGGMPPGGMPPGGGGIQIP